MTAALPTSAGRPSRRNGVRDFGHSALRFDKRLTTKPFGDNDAWGNGVDADMVRAEFRHQGIRQLPQPSLLVL